MTDAEIQRSREDAREDAAIIGGIVALLLGRRSVVTWENGKFKKNGRTVSITTVRAALSQIERSMGARVTVLASRLEKGNITPDEWQREFKRSVSSSHIIAGALALGSIFAAAGDEDVQGRVIAEHRYADDFGDEIRKGKTTGIAPRSRSYLLAAAVTFSVVEQKIRGVLGYEEAKRIRRASESCPGCVQWSGRWIPINSMPRIGSLECGSRCRCYLVYQ